MLKATLTAAALALLAGCASDPGVWQRMQAAGASITAIDGAARPASRSCTVTHASPTTSHVNCL